MYTRAIVCAGDVDVVTGAEGERNNGGSLIVPPSLCADHEHIAGLMA